MKSSTRGADTSQVEVSNIDRFGLWVLIGGQEYFLPYDEFPWFRHATVQQILNVDLLRQGHLHWPEIDVDLCVDGLSAPERFPLIYR